MSASETAGGGHTRILIVHGEPAGAAAMSALLARAGYEVRTAKGVTDALRALEREPVELVISTMQLMDGDGAALLEQTAARWPDGARLLLVPAAAEAGAREAAVERAEAHFWLLAPFREGELRLAVKQVLHQRFIDLERRRLTAQLRQQQEKPERAATAGRPGGSVSSDELRQTVGFLEATQDALRKSHMAVIKMCANLVGLRDPGMAAYSRVVAEHARALAEHLGMDDTAVQDVIYAALLHHIGKLCLPDHLLNKAFELLTPAEHIELNRYPVVGESLLIGIEPLQNAARCIRAQNECYDGHGQPDGLAGERIPLGARILAVVKGYHALQRGGVDGQRHNAAQAVEFLRRNKARRYDPKIVDAFLEVRDRLRQHIIAEPVLCIASSELRPGMVLARDVVTESGVALLTKDHVLDMNVIGRIRQSERASGDELMIFVWGQAPGSGGGAGRG